MFIDDDNNDKFLIILAFLFACSYFLYLNVLNVNAHSIDLSEYEFEYIDENDESLGVVYYEHNIVSVNTNDFDEDEYVENLRNSNFLDYPYWVMYQDTIYASDYPFVFGGDNNNYLYAYDFGNKFNVSYVAYKLGVSVGMRSVQFLSIDPDLHELNIRSNHDVKYLSGDFGDLKRVESYETPSYDTSRYPYVVKFGYYTIISRSPLFLHSNPDMENILGLYSPDAGKTSIMYSYLGSEFRSPINSLLVGNHIHGYKERYGFLFESPYPSNSNFLSLLGVLNYDLFYGYPLSSGRDNRVVYYDVFFEFMNPPKAWESFDPNYIRPPENFGGDGGGSGDGEENIFREILSYLNPFSDNFFLLVAFVPRDDYFADKMQELASVNNSKLEPLISIASSLNVLFSTDLDNVSGWDGIGYGDKFLTAGYREIFVHGIGSHPPPFCKNPVKIPGGGLGGDYYSCAAFRFNLSNFKLLDASYITAFISRFRYLVGSVMNLFFSFWLLRWALSIFGYNMPHGGYSPGGNDRYASFLKDSGYI